MLNDCDTSRTDFLPSTRPIAVSIKFLPNPGVFFFISVLMMINHELVIPFHTNYRDSCFYIQLFLLYVVSYRFGKIKKLYSLCILTLLKSYSGLF